MAETRARPFPEQMPPFDSHYVPSHYPTPAVATRSRADSSASMKYTPASYSILPRRNGRSNTIVHLAPHLTPETGAMARYEPPRSEQYAVGAPSHEAPDMQLYPYHPDPYHQAGPLVKVSSQGRSRGYSSDSRNESDSGRSQKSHHSSRSRPSDDDERPSEKSRHHYRSRHHDKDSDRASAKSHKSHRSHKSSRRDYDDSDSGRSPRRAATRRSTVSGSLPSA